jgi:hypothetical protein
LEDSVDVLEEGVANDPGWGALGISDSAPDVENATSTHLVFPGSADSAEVHIISGDGPGSTAEREGDGNGGGACWLSDRAVSDMNTAKNCKDVRKEYMPWYWPVNATEPGTFDQISVVMSEGAPMRVVPVSMAARPSLLETEMDLPWMVTAKEEERD